MRISDWSSDVCSSDLTAASAFNAAETSTERASGPKLSNSKFMAGLARLRRRQKGYRSPSQPLRPAPSAGDRAALRQGRAPGELPNYPNFDSPQLKPVAHQTLITTALVRHMWQLLADGRRQRTRG